MSLASMSTAPSSSVAEVVTMGRPSLAEIASIRGACGTRMPTWRCLLCIISGTSRVASSTKVKGPGVSCRMMR